MPRITKNQMTMNNTKETKEKELLNQTLMLNIKIVSAHAGDIQLGKGWGSSTLECKNFLQGVFDTLNKD